MTTDTGRQIDRGECNGRTHHSTSNRPETASSTGTEGSWILHRYTELLGSWVESEGGLGEDERCEGGWEKGEVG